MFCPACYICGLYRSLRRVSTQLLFTAFDSRSKGSDIQLFYGHCLVWYRAVAGSPLFRLCCMICRVSVCCMNHSQIGKWKTMSSLDIYLGSEHASLPAVVGAMRACCNCVVSQGSHVKEKKLDARKQASCITTNFLHQDPHHSCVSVSISAGL